MARNLKFYEKRSGHIILQRYWVGGPDFIRREQGWEALWRSPAKVALAGRRQTDEETPGHPFYQGIRWQARLIHWEGPGIGLEMLVMPKDVNAFSDMTTTSCIVQKQRSNHDLPPGRRQEAL